MMAIMEIARLILDFFKVLIWPLVVLVILYGFRRQVNELAGRIVRANFLGLEIEAASREAARAAEEAIQDVRPEHEQPIADRGAQEWLNPPLVELEGGSPGARAHRAINDLDRLLRRLAFEADPDLVGRSPRSAAHALSERGVLNRAFLEAFNELITIRNEGISRNVNEPTGERLWTSAQQLIVVVQLQRHALTLNGTQSLPGRD